MSYTLAFEGRCSRCKQTEKAYYYYADRRHRDMMTNGTFMSDKSNCPRCVTSPIFQSTHTMVWFRKLSDTEAANDLMKLTNGSVNINWADVDATVKEYEKNDAWLENQEKRVDEYVKWKKKKS